MNLGNLGNLQPLTRTSGRVRSARQLQRRRTRAERGLFLAEGDKAVREAADAGGVVEVFATDAATAEHADLAERLGADGVPWQPTEDDAVASLAGAVTPQGLVAVCRRVDVPLDQALARDGAVVVCADVRDPGNAGTIIRTADATAAAGVVLAGRSVDPHNDKTVRATVGSLWHLPVVVAPDLEDCLARLREAGRTVLAADGAGELDLHDDATTTLLRGPVAWLFGNEARGLPTELAAAADHRVACPVPGRAESLNLSVAVAVCLYEGLRARR